ncbi:MAG: redoxin family protein, partial [Gallionella sp.]
MMRFILPLVLFLGLSWFLFQGLGRDTREVPSPLVGKAAPAFVLPTLHDEAKKFSPADMQGKVWLLNVWASWCGACKDEH